MYYFLKSEGVDLWDIVENGPFFPTRVIDGNQEQKPKSEWSELEKRRVALNDKAIHILLCALSRSEYNKVCMKSTAKEIWDALVVTHEGTNQVKENKMESLIYQYELFKMKSDETISQMYDRFIEIIGGMKSLGKTFTNEELVKKILRCLPKEWLPKVTSLKDAKDLSKVQLDELLGNLIDYEMTLKREQVEEPSKMKKNIALRVASEDTSEEEEEISEEELALFIPRKNFRKEKGESSKKEVVICYECNKPGHYKVDCPKLKKHIKKFKKKAFKATWDESSDTEEEEVGDEIANMCFMALEESSDEVCLKSSKIESKWYLDSGCSRHMTGNSSHFISLEKKDGSGQVTFGDNGKGKIVGIGKVGKENSPMLDKVLLVDGLKHNLLSVSQLCDKGCRIIFEPKSCFVSRMSDNKILFVGERVENIYLIDLQAMTNLDMKCFVSISDNSWIWHRRLSHPSMDLLKNLSKDELVDGLPKIKYKKDKVCDACQMGKQVKSSFKSINKVISSRPLQLLHMDLFGPTRVASLGGMHYGFVIVDDYSRYTWVVFLAHKDDCFDTFKTINTACYVSNRVLIRPLLNKIPYELWNGRKPRVSYFRVFGCKCFILNNKDNLGKFESKTDEGIFLGYSISSKSYRVFNKRTLIVKESMHVVFDESNPFAPRKEVSCDDDLVGNLDELTIEDPQPHGDQSQPKEDSIEAKEDEVGLQ
ncbi:hypothetical protein MANES_17G033205v8 [Manihot esculenta]|uniref:Uncharacterized protein n=1 Tax=Manihot esculenta TaxID=3983 RepID=A0ACB7G3J1_MANES|nr:hypothetical protein MANES_17G033205v8 [Manihot esculenta]